jgi:hypothetical protein
MTPASFKIYLKALDKCEDVQGILCDEWVIHPPNRDFGYAQTPRNAVTFAEMGVDGVHYSILEVDGVIDDDSPIIQVCPMDSDTYQVLADSFVSFLAQGCGVSVREMEAVFVSELITGQALVEFLRARFTIEKVWNTKRSPELDRLLDLIEQKP